jgi:hypothetical protein
MDSSLLKEPCAQLFQGIDEQAPSFVNGDATRFEMNLKEFSAARFLFLDLSAIARKLIGGPFVSAAAAAVAARCVPFIQRSALEDAVRTELAEFYLAAASIECSESIITNLAAFRH